MAFAVRSSRYSSFLSSFEVFRNGFYTFAHSRVFSQATLVVRKLAGRYFFIVGEQLFFDLPSEKRAPKNGDGKESRRAGHFLVVGKEYMDLRHAVGIKLRSRRSHDPCGRARKKSPLWQQSQRDKFFVLSREKCLFSRGCI